MKTILVCLLLLIAGYASAQTVYLVRHGEKATPAPTDEMMKKDPPLSDDGLARADALLALIKDEQITITHIFSTPYKRTRATVEPVRAHFNLNTVDYQRLQDSVLTAALQQPGASILIAGHSNTVDDLVNGILGEKKLSDLPDTSFDNLYVLVKEKGKWRLEQRKYGMATD